MMLLQLLSLTILAALVSGNPVQKVQVIPVSPVNDVQQSSSQPIYVPVGQQQPQQQVVYVLSPQADKPIQYDVFNQLHQTQPSLVQPSGHYQTPEGFTIFSTHQQEAVSHAVHNPPPAPPGSTSSYVATLSYGPGYPTISYHCYFPGRHPAPPGGYVVKGTNNYLCSVTYHNPGNYHVVNLIDHYVPSELSSHQNVHSEQQQSHQ